MFTYHSTRSEAFPVTPKEAIQRGIAPDGGLFVSDALGETQLDISQLANMDYRAIARAVMGALLPDFTESQINRVVDSAYRGTFTSEEVTPLVALESDPDTYVLELYHGPTSAFKDVALQALPHLMSCAVADTGASERVMIVTATSGDTGKAALAGFADAPGCGITVFYPAGKVSAVQKLQMTTQEGANVSVCAVEGNFDDAQSEVKRIFADRALAERLQSEGIALSSANSINIGRLIPQVSYYFAAYAQLLRAHKISCGDAVEFCVPTGNFGDILAGYYAKRMGLPVSRLIVASDKNNVLIDFLNTGTYDKDREFFTTTSPSMDILISSNFERMLYYLSGNDCALVSQLMDDLSRTGSYSVSQELLSAIRAIFDGGWADEDEVSRAIRSCWEKNRYVIDPHTACGYHVLTSTEKCPDSAARVLLSTASPYKFPRVVAQSLGLFCPPNDFACMDVLQKATGTTAPTALSSLPAREERFHDVREVAQMNAYVERAALDLAQH